MYEAFHEALDGDESDNDEALDTNWVPSDCEISENDNIKTKGQPGGVDLSTGTLLTEFYEWLTDVDGVYRSEKMAQQYKSQVLSVIKRLQMNETEVRHDNPKPALASWKRRSNSVEAMVVICCFQVPTWNCALISYEFAFIL